MFYAEHERTALTLEMTMKVQWISADGGCWEGAGAGSGTWCIIRILDRHCHICLLVGAISQTGYSYLSKRSSLEQLRPAVVFCIKGRNAKINIPRAFTGVLPRHR